MRFDPITYSVDQQESPASAPHFPLKETHSFRLLGEHEGGTANANHDWDDTLPPFLMSADSSPLSPQSSVLSPRYHAPQFALYAEVESVRPDSYAQYRPALFARLANLLKRLVLPVTLLFMGVGLFVVITGPVLARDLTGSRSAGMRVSGYWEQSGVVGLPSEAAVPVIEVRSDPQGEQHTPPVQPAAVGDGPYDVVGPPSTSVEQIERVLTQYRSPAAGKGKVMYDLGVRYGIDPAYALAFFVHESGCGTQGVARFTHSLGNIRWTKGFENYQGYRKYPSWEEGMEDWYKLITELYIGAWNLRTVDKIIPVYAPWGDNNNPPAYIRSVKGMVEDWRGK